MALKDLFFTIFAQDKTGTAFDSVEDKMKRAGDASDKLGTRLDTVGKRFATLGVATGAATAVIGMGLKDAITAAADWEAALNRTQAAIKPTNEQMEQLGDLTRKLGRDTKFSAGEAAGAVEMLGKNGLNASQILDGALTASLDAAAAAGAGLSDAADVVTDAMASFGVKTSELDRVVNGMSGTMVASKMDFDDYRLALGQAGGVAGGVGVSLEDFNTALAATSTLFASGSDAGTSFKTFLTTLTGKSAKAGALIDQLGMEFYDASGNMKSMADIAQELQDGLSGLSDEAKTSKMTEIFGTDAMRTAIGLARAGKQGFEEFQKQIGDVSAAEQAEARMMGAAGAMEKWNSAVEGFGIAVAQSGVLDAFTSLVDMGTDVVNWLGEADPMFLRAGTAAAVLVAAIAPLAGVVAAVTIAFGALSAPVLAVVGGAVALAAAFAAFWPEIQSSYEWVSGKLGPALEWVQGIFAAIPQPVKDVATVVAALANPFALVAIGVDDFGASFSRVFENVKTITIDTVTAVSDWLGNKFNALMDSVGSKVEWVEGKFFWLYDKVVGNSWVPDLVEEIGKSFGQLDGNMVKVTDDATGSVNDSFKGLWSDVSGGLKGMVTDGELTFTGFMETLNNVGTRYADKIVDNVFDTLSDGIFNALSSAFSGASTGGSASSGGLGGLFSSADSWASGLLGFDTGGSFTVTGRAGMDRNVAAVRLSEGEEVNVTKRGQSAGNTVNVYIQTQDVSSFKSSKAQIGRQLSAAVNASLRGA